MKKIFFSIIFILAIAPVLFSQNEKDSLKNSKNKLDIHFVAGFKNGLRAGIRYYFLGKYSVEFSYGFPISSFGGDSYNIYELGLNMYPFKQNSIMTGLMFSYYHRPERFDSPYDAVGLTPYIGFLAERDNGFMFHARGGLHFRYYDAGNSKYLSVRVDLELGFAIDLF